tara:strand:- start:29267 stop:29812 length:546 start_codon:yes stop_codon:yes gene_type:complete
MKRYAEVAEITQRTRRKSVYIPALSSFGYSAVMRPTEETAQSKPVWEVHARPINASHEPWRVMRVEARSAIQAQAILRRRGYEMALESAVRSVGPGQVIPPAELKQLACASCGYELAGLTIEKASVCCPECSFQQPLMVWDPDLAAGRPQTGCVTQVLAIFGFLTIVLILFIIMAGVFGWF